MNSDEPNNGARLGDELNSEEGLLKEFWTFLMENKIWWITPAVLILLVMVAFSSS